MIPARVSRRLVFLMVFLVILAPFVFATGKPEPKPAATAPAPAPAKGGNEWHESPMLHTKVVASQLPPLAQRLPKDIFVEKVVEEIGEYGGDWNMTWNGLGAKWGIGSTTEEAMFRFTPDGKAVIPNVAKSVKINDNFTEFTITLREGMKWSDGVPFTADDVIFFWEELLVPGTYSKQVLGYPAFYTIAADGKKVLCKVEKIDMYTVKITHAKSFPTFLQRMAIDTKWFFAPAHYYKTILPKFVGQEKALEIAKKHGFGDLTAWLKEVGYYYWQYPERPTLRAWKPVNDATETRWILERNPYFWKTDEQGNQLPYIDRIVIDLTEDKLVPMKAIAGELDCQDLSTADYTLIKENEKKGDYRVIAWKSAGTSTNTVELNQTVKDAGLRPLFTDQRFRAGLSVAINRNEVNEIVYGGRQIPQQASILEGLPYSSTTWSKKYAEYDPAGAAKYFDAVGLPWDKDHKYRTRPDGSELLMLVHYATQPTNDQVFELVKKYWEAVGLKTEAKPVERSFLEQLRNSNDFQIASWGMQVFDIKLRPDELVPTRVLNYWSGMYGPYYESSGKIGEKATGDIALLQEDMGKMLAATTLTEMDSWAKKIAELHEKNIWIIGITGGSPTTWVVKNNFRNVPAGLFNTDELRYLGVANPVQFFIKGGK
jgi:peptide/nickel transport system substrate-binding protein